MSEEKVNALTEEGEIYHHWLSLALYDLHHVLPEDKVNEPAKDIIEFNFKGTSYSISCAVLDGVLACWNSCDGKKTRRFICLLSLPN